jgi:nitrite reductase/ring-hydroxylating ferredoxin subunit
VSGDGWHAVSLSSGIDAGRSAGTRLFDKEIVLWRDTNGVAHAWEDRCPHRGMRLSFGFVRGDRIACLYHGWQYDAEGQCQFIPAHPELKVPGTIRVTTYLCREHLGIVWMCDAAAATTSAELAIEDRAVTPVRSVHIDCPFGAAVEALGTQGKILDERIGLLSLRADGLPLLIAAQHYGDARTALHIVIDGSHDTYGGAVQIAAATWAEQIRHELESEAAAAADSIAYRRALP